MNDLRSQTIYHGRVQGVGFRWLVSKEVENHLVTGFVKNLPDGSVELLLEGNEKEVKRAAMMIDHKTSQFWEKKSIQARKGGPHFDCFSIMH